MTVQEFLAEKKVPFEVLEHEETFDAQHMAHAIHVSGHHVAKTVLLRAGEDYVVAVLPASLNLDLDKAAELVGVDNVELATEVEISEKCPDCEMGALPPFGSQYQMKTIFDESMTSDEEIVFEGTNHHESIRMNLGDFQKLEQPIVGSFSA